MNMTKQMRLNRAKIKGFICVGPSKTKQSETEEADINNIMAKANQFGSLPQNNGKGYFADVSNIGDFQNSLDSVQEIQENFNALSAQVRKRFDYNPQKLFEFVSDDSNRQEAIFLGVVEKPSDTIAEMAVKDHPDYKKPASSPKGGGKTPVPPPEEGASK